MVHCVFELVWQDIATRAASICSQLENQHSLLEKCRRGLESVSTVFAFGIPTGGIFAALSVQAAAAHNKHSFRIRMCSNPDNADIYIDDIYDSGETSRALSLASGAKPIFFLVDKREEFNGIWVQFPWERMSTHQETGPEDNVRRILQFIGEDPNREGLRDTPRRVAKAWKEMCAGYSEDPASIMTVFEDGCCDEMVILRDIDFVSFCEHHMLPFTGKAHIAYVPNKKVLGVSKLVRLLQIYAKRLQIQERLSQQVTAALDTHLQPKGSACVIEASHMCMVCRGVKKQNSVMITSSLTGVFKESGAARQEFMSLIRG